MPSTLLPSPAELRLDHLISGADAVTMVVAATRESAPCPECQQPSRRVHSRYTRTLADLPWNGVAVRLQLHTRRFFCSSLTCARQIFTERLPATAARYARRTRRLEDTLQQLGLLAGGAPGARLSEALGLKTSGDTLLRRARQYTPGASANPRVLGVDDWAWKRGHRYGTILVDLERHAVLDLLPDREASSLERWLQQHPGVEILSRDRSSAYAEAATKGAPQAVQVADRWHLLKNLTDAVERVLQSKQGQLRQAAKAIAPKEQTSPTPAVPAAQSVPLPRSRAQQQSHDKRERRHERYQQVMALHKKGASQVAISRTLHIQRKTIRRWLRAGQFPERAKPKRSRALDRYLPHLEARWAEGCHNATQLWREIREQGHRGAQGMVRQWAGSLRRTLPPDPQHAGARCAPKAADTVPTPRQAAWLLLRQEQPRKAETEQDRERRAFVEVLYEIAPEVRRVAKVAHEFRRLLRERDAKAWPAWKEAAKQTLLASFARHRQRDERAVEAAITSPWSNGQVEGQVHRLKLIKRQMYGRAKLDLLKARVLYKAP